MKKRTSQEIWTGLVQKRNVAGASLYDRIRDADELLSDHDWVSSPEGGGGDESTAIDRIEDVCFGDTGHSLLDMIELLRSIPEEKTWREQKYNLKRMLSELRERKRASQPVPQPRRNPVPVPPLPAGNPTTSDMGEREELLHLRNEVKILRQENKEQAREIRKLRRSLVRMKKVLGSLQGV